MRAHFQERAQSRGIGYAFSLPVDRAALADLPDLLQTPLGNAPGACDLALQPQFSVPARPALADDTGDGHEWLPPVPAEPSHDTACLRLVQIGSKKHHTVQVAPGATWT
eukprot:2486831-Lingulodinium_polyedra.AAC.1